MLDVDRAEAQKILRDLRIIKEKRMQALNIKRAQKHGIQAEIEGIEKEVADLESSIIFFERF